MTQPAETSAALTRYFVRCQDCLSVAAVDVPRGTFATYRQSSARCAACNGAIETMGEVHMDRLITRETRCACDERCTSARGPVCVCQCGGKNHGRNVVVEIIHDAGSVPRVQMMRPDHARRVRDEYHEAIARVLATIDGLRARRRNGEYLPAADYQRLNKADRAITKARLARCHRSRMATLHTIAPPPAEPMITPTSDATIGSVRQVGLF